MLYNEYQLGNIWSRPMNANVVIKLYLARLNILLQLMSMWDVMQLVLLCVVPDDLTERVASLKEMLERRGAKIMWEGQ